MRKYGRVVTLPYLRPVVATLVALLPISAAAQNIPTFSVSMTEPSELVEEVGTTRRITRADIEARSARTLDEALRLLPGIYVRTGGDGTPRIDVRGFRSRHVLLLINGVPANSTADGQFDPARISTEAIREIKVSYGSSSVLYGDNALAARHRDHDDRRHARTPSFEGQRAARRISRASAAAIARTVGKWSLTATATGYSTDGFRLPGSLRAHAARGRRPPAEQRSRSRRCARRGRLPRVAAVVDRVGMVVRERAATACRAEPSPTPATSSRRRHGSNASRTIARRRGQVSVVVAPSQRFNLRAWVFRNRQREDRARYDDATYSSMDDPLVPGTFQSRERTTVTGGSALARLDLERFGWLRLAVNQRRESFDSSGVIRDVAGQWRRRRRWRRRWAWRREREPARDVRRARVLDRSARGRVLRPAPNGRRIR